LAGKHHREKIKRKGLGLILLSEILGIDEVFLSSENLNKSHALAKLKEKVFSCKKCPLHRTSTNYVFGEGNPYAPLMLVGEAPGREEDISGKPFVGKAGQLLTKALGEEGVERGERTYIANVLKCRPPGNRDPLPDEISACSPYLDSQILIVNPDVLVAMGRFAAHFLLDREASIRELRGYVHKSRYGIPVVVTYHPAALLRNPNLYSAFKSDIKLALELIGGEG